MAERNGGWDLQAPRPWKAEPVDPDRPEGAWRVTCPSKTGRAGERWEVCSWISEQDAKRISAAPEMQEAIPALLKAYDNPYANDAIQQAAVRAGEEAVRKSKEGA